MLRELVLCVILQYATATYDCPAFGAPIDPACPVAENIDGVRTCYAMINAEYGSAFTFLSGNEECKAEYGENAHLANVYDKRCFEDIRCYVIAETSTRRSLDKKVLLGMTYDIDNEVTSLYNGKKQKSSYWGENSHPLSYGTNMVLRASEQYSRTKLTNFGGEEERYDRILCEFVQEK